MFPLPDDYVIDYFCDSTEYAAEGSFLRTRASVRDADPVPVRSQILPSGFNRFDKKFIFRWIFFLDATRISRESRIQSQCDRKSFLPALTVSTTNLSFDESFFRLQNDYKNLRAKYIWKINKYTNFHSGALYFFEILPILTIASLTSWL